MPTSVPASVTQCHIKDRNQSLSPVAGHGIEHAGFLLLDAVHDLILVLDEACRVVTANKAMLIFLDIPDATEIYGRRPGDIFRCSCHMECESQGGCGFNPACGGCGMIAAFTEASKGMLCLRDYQIIRCLEEPKMQQAADFRVKTSRIEINNRTLIVAALVDQTQEKRRRNMERIFFHDVLNTVGGLVGLTDCLQTEAPSTMRADLGLVHSALATVIDEIKGQKELIEAETGELTPNFLHIDVAITLHMLARTFSRHPLAEGKSIQVDAHERLPVHTDPTILRRVLSNMLKNALEAESEPCTITVSGKMTGNGLIIGVHNPSAMTSEAQLQVFHRCYSSKGFGRGLGTYSIKLLSESYLQAEVGFQSSQAEGTTFSITLPKEVAEL